MENILAYSYATYNANGITSTFIIPFSYLDQSHVQVRVDGVEVPFSFLTGYTVSVTPAPTGSVEVRRVTPKDNPPVNFSDGSVLREEELDLLALFGLYCAQEAQDTAEEAVFQSSLGTALARVYQGTLSANPTVRSDGTPLEVGDLYYNDVALTMRVYTGTLWSPIGTTVPGILNKPSSPVIATGGQTVVAVPGGFDPTAIVVFLNGSLVDPTDVTISSGTDIVFTSPLATLDEVTWLAFGVFQVANAWTKLELSAPNGSSVIGTKAAGVGAVPRTVQSILNEDMRFTDYGAKFDGATDDTAAINAAILAAYKAASLVLSPNGEIYSIVIKAPAAKEFYIAGKILLPSQVILDFNGCRMRGIDPNGGNEPYDPAGQHAIETAYYDEVSGALISNVGAVITEVWRVVGSGIKNLAVLNCNCPFNLVNFQELSFTEHIRISNCSTSHRLKNCYYSTHTRAMIRYTARAAGQQAILMHGIAGHLITFANIFCSGSSVLLRNTCTTALGVVFRDGSCEGAYNALDGGGVDGTAFMFDTGYSEAWEITGNYIEAVRYGFQNANGGTCFAFTMNNEVNTTEYAVKAGINGFRNSTWLASANSDGGGVTRNFVDFSASGNDVLVQLPAKSGSAFQAYPSNILLGNTTSAVSTSVWTRLSDGTAIAKSDPGLANQNQLNSFAFEGAQMVSVANEVPFCTLVRAVDTLTLNTLLKYDDSNILSFNLYGGTDTVAFDLKGFIFGSTVSWVTRTPVGVVLTVNNVGGYVQLVLSNLTAAVPVINVSGLVRHV